MATKDINLVSIDNDELKNSLISFLKTTDEFKDFDYEGSAITTLIDMLVFNTTYYTFFANMVANESMLQHAQKRNNVVVHAEKLGYVPKSVTASRLVCDIIVKGYTASGIVNDNMITLEKGKQFICSYEDSSYTFTNIKDYNAYYDSSTNSYTFKSVTLYQGTLSNTQVKYTGDAIVLSNANTDMDTVTIDEVIAQKPYKREYRNCKDISNVNHDSNVYYVREQEDLTYSVGFGKNIIGREPATGATLNLQYVICDDEIGNGVDSVVAATLINGLADITVKVTTAAWGGSLREDIETVRMLAPRYSEAQKRAVTYNDYAALIRDRFPVISDVSVWGGENANPPSYGVVYISVVMSGNPLGYIGVKDQIVKYLDDKKVGVVTPVVVEPDKFTLTLDMIVTSESNITTEIKAATAQYGKGMGLFNQSFNQSQYTYQLMSLDDIVSIDDIEKTVSVSHTSVDQGFWYDYGNTIKKGTYTVYDSTGVIAIDDGLGNIVNASNSDVIGSIVYSTGIINISQWGYTSSPTTKFKVSGKHFNVNNNMICELGEVNITFK